MASQYQYGQPVTDEQRLVLESSANNPGQIISSTRPIVGAGATTPSPFSAYTTTGNENIIGTPGQSMSSDPFTNRAANDSMPMRSQYGSDASYLSAYNAWQAGGSAPVRSAYNPQGSSSSGSTGTTGSSGTPTIGQVYGSATGNSELDAAYDAQGNAIKATQTPIDENKIREQTLQRFQAEIDAINRFYAEKTARQQEAERIIGSNRSGSNRAIMARRGMLASYDGEAQTEKINGFNNQQLQGIADLNNAQAMSEIEAIRGQARQEAQQEIKDKQAAMAKGRQEYIDFLNGQKDRLDKRADTSVAALLARNTDATDVELGQIATDLGIDVKTLKDKYAIAKAAKAAASEKDANYQSIAPGSSLYKNGVLVGTTPAKPADGKPIIEKFADNTTRQWNEKTNTWDTLATPADGKPIIEKFADNTTRQWNEKTNTWDTLATGTEKKTQQTVTLDTGVYRLTYDDNGNEVGRDRLGSSPSSATVKPPTEAERSAFGFYNRATQASGTLNDLESSIAGSGMKGQIGLKLPTPLQSSDLQQYTQARRQFTEAYLRKDSGAVISPSEYEAADVTYFPQPGDTPQVLARKKSARETILNSLKSQAGNAYTQSYGDTPAPQTTAPVSDYGSKIKAALDQGWSPPEIITKLQNDPSVSQKIKDAQANGWSPEEIIQHLQKSFNQVPSTTQNGSKPTIVTVPIGNKRVSVNSAISDKLALADADFFNATGKHLAINEAVRSNARQAELYTAFKSGKGGRAAPPGKSFHETGNAVDVANWKEAEPYLRKYGFKNNLADDKNHFSVGEFA